MADFHITSDTNLLVQMKLSKFNIFKGKKPVVIIADSTRNKSAAERLVSIARSQELHPILGGAVEEGVIRINIPESEAKCFLALVLENCPENEGFRFLYKDSKHISPRKLSKRGMRAAYDIAIIVYSDDLHDYVSLIQIAIWREIERYGRKLLSVNRPSRIVSRVPHFGVLKDFDTIDDINKEFTDTTKSDFPIDVVFTWVDGNDREWRKQKAEFSDQSDVQSGALDERFKNRDELRFALRSIEMFMPFVRKVYIVTADQVPDWLDTSYDRVKVVNHKEIYSDIGHLPTFNSHSIESHLHEIEGLSEHFVYFNDDMMAGKLASRDDFFCSNGIAKVYPDNMFVIPELLEEKDHSFIRSSAKAVKLFRRDFGVSPSSMIKHVPYAVRRSVMYELQERYKEEFRVTSSNKFRDPSDIPPISFFYSHYAVMTGNAVTCAANHRYIPLFSPDLEKSLSEQMIVKKRKKYICLNDAAVPETKKDKVDAIVGSFLNSYYPIKCKFEK